LPNLLAFFFGPIRFFPLKNEGERKSSWPPFSPYPFLARCSPCKKEKNPPLLLPCFWTRSPSMIVWGRLEVTGCFLVSSPTFPLFLAVFFFSFVFVCVVIAFHGFPFFFPRRRMTKRQVLQRKSFFLPFFFFFFSHCHVFFVIPSFL